MESWLINIPHILFLYWDRQARVLEVELFEKFIKYYYIKERIK